MVALSFDEDDCYLESAAAHHIRLSDCCTPVLIHKLS